MERDEIESRSNAAPVEVDENEARLVGDLVRDIMREIGRENLVRPLPSKGSSPMRFGGGCGGDHAVCCSAIGSASTAARCSGVGILTLSHQPCTVV